MSGYQEPGISREQAKRKADEREATRIADVGKRLMQRYNRDLTDPTVMAVVGHDTTFGYQFFVQEDGVTYIVEVRRDMGD
jgi:hypothetical protein